MLSIDEFIKSKKAIACNTKERFETIIKRLTVEKPFVKTIMVDNWRVYKEDSYLVIINNNTYYGSTELNSPERTIVPFEKTEFYRQIKKSNVKR